MTRLDHNRALGQVGTPASQPASQPASITAYPSVAASLA